MSSEEVAYITTPPRGRRGFYLALIVLAAAVLVVSLWLAWRAGPWPWLAVALVAAFGLPWAVYAWHIWGQISYQLTSQALVLRGPNAQAQIALARIVWAGLEAHLAAREISLPRAPAGSWGLHIGLLDDEATGRRWAFYAVASAPYVIIETDDGTFFVLTPARPADLLEQLRARFAEPTAAQDVTMPSPSPMTSALDATEAESQANSALPAQAPTSLPTADTTTVAETTAPAATEMTPLPESTQAEAPAPEAEPPADTEPATRASPALWGWGLLAIAWAAALVPLGFWFIGARPPNLQLQMTLAAHFLFLGVESGLAFYAWRAWHKPAMGLALSVTAAAASLMMAVAFWALSI
ncbi:MAG: hypothetical protein GXO54_04275 [Chloroflexi bacterium]|nr:hypothetical protein [Chloroflexota bacterium]